MSQINIESQLRYFQDQKYPTVEQTVSNNASVLYKRKKFFLEDLRQTVQYLGFILLAIVYLRDLSMVQLGMRAFSQFSISNPFPTAHNILLSDENKRAISKFLLVGIIMGNGLCIIIHILFGRYSKSPYPDGYLYGGLTVQFIGERIPYSTWELLALDVLVLGVQLVFHSLMCETRDSEVLELKKLEVNFSDGETIDKAYIESDGYNGNVYLLTIDFLKTSRKVLSYVDVLNTNMGQAPVVPPPGAYPEE